MCEKSIRNCFFKISCKSEIFMVVPCVIGRMDISSKIWSGLYERNKESQSCSLRGGVFPCHNSHPSNSSVIKDLRFEMVMDRARSASTCALAACSRLLFLFSTCRHACCILRAPLNFCQQWVWILFSPLCRASTMWQVLQAAFKVINLFRQILQVCLIYLSHARFAPR